jgi:hypothetical protein
MAGEWIVGGVEAKGFAFVLVFLGLEALVRNRWNRVWLLFGAAAAFHVLVGGWSVVAAGLAWLGLGKDRASLRAMGPAILGGFLLSLPGLIPSLMLNWGTDREVVGLANQVYVYGRLAHHLAPTQLPPNLIARFVLLVVLWLVLSRITAGEARLRRLRAFAAGSIAIAIAGLALSLLSLYDRVLAAGLLRYYWFRLADVGVPMGVALTAAALDVQTLKTRPFAAKCWLTIAILLSGTHVGWHAVQRLSPMLPCGFRQQANRSCRDRVGYYAGWRDVCAWIARPENTPRDARFLTPMMAQTFKWYAGRSEVVNWKEIPQDAEAIVEWWWKIHDLYATGRNRPNDYWHRSLADLGAERLKGLGEHYSAHYVVTVARPRVNLEVVYENRWYVVYKAVVSGTLQRAAR